MFGTNSQTSIAERKVGDSNIDIQVVICSDGPALSALSDQLQLLHFTSAPSLEELATSQLQKIHSKSNTYNLNKVQRQSPSSLNGGEISRSNDFELFSIDATRNSRSQIDLDDVNSISITVQNSVPIHINNSTVSVFQTRLYSMTILPL